MIRRPLLTLLFLVLAACTTAPRRASDSIAIPPTEFKSRTLANGLTVYSLHDQSTSNVAVSIFYEVGGKHDPDKRAGFAHLFEHLLSRKTVNMTYNMINRMVEEVGGIRSARSRATRAASAR